MRLKPLGHPSIYYKKKRREWDSNPRGPETNALAGRRLKPLGHPSKTEVLIKRSISELPR